MNKIAIFLFSFLLIAPLIGTSQTCGRIGLIGEHTQWSSDIFLTRNSENPDEFSGIVTLADNTDTPNDTVEVKFRENADWANNWGGDSSSVAVFDGSNIILDPGTYWVSFNCTTLAYSFTSTCGSIGLIGEHNGWAGDVVMTRDANNINLFTALVTLAEDASIEEPNDTVEVKFRENGDWALNWGATDFPNGTGTTDNAPNIPVPAGTYKISFDCSTGEYSFTATCGSIGLIGEMTEWNSDIVMTRSESNPDMFTAILSFDKNTLGAEDGIIELKFRENGEWTLNWGATDFPNGTGTTDNAPNIPVPVDTLASATTYLVSFNCSTGEYSFEPTCGEVSMIGEFVNWNGDIPMNRDATDPNIWRLTYSFASTFDSNADGMIESKFRQNKDWVVNWGSDGFPNGTGTTENAPNIPVPVDGVYDIMFNCSTGEYSFTPNETACGQIGMIGAFNNFGIDDAGGALPTDVLMVRDANSPSTFTLNYNFTSSTTLLFRQDADLAFNDVWGGTTFPEGTGVKDPSLFINVTGGSYDISFNCLSGDYAFTRLGNSVIAPKVFAINVDGSLNEGDWNLDQTVSRVVEGEAGDDPNGVTFGLNYTDENLFVAVDVSDADVVTAGDSLNDGVQIFLDGNKSGGAYDDNDIHLWVDAAGSVTVITGPDGIAPSAAAQTTGSGYSIEVAINFVELGVTPGTSMGFDLGVRDVDGENSSLMVWNGGVGNAESTSSFGDLIFGSLKCGNISMYNETIGDVGLQTLTDAPNTYVATYMFEEDASVVFRKDNESTVSWGDAAFPMGTGTVGGDAIPVTAGRYRVSFGCLDGAYSFTEEAASDAVAFANYAESPATIDGDLSEFSLDYGLDAGVVDGAGELNNTMAWGALWDGEYMYIGAQIEDAVVMGSTNLNPWEQDGVEMYIDGNHDSDGTYDGDFDTQIILSFAMTEGDLMWTKADGAPITEDDFEAIYVLTDDGYNIEMKLKWSVFGFSPGNNRSVGFTIGINDTDANATGREYQAAWVGDGNNWNNTAVFGDLQLTGGPLTSIREPLYNASVLAMPNPTNGNLRITTKDQVFVGNTELTISSIMGQTLMSKQAYFQGSYDQTEIDLGALSPGIYLLNLKSEEGKRAVMKIVKK